MTSTSNKAVRVSSCAATVVLWLITLVLSTAAVYYTYTLAVFVYSILGGKQIFTGILIGQIAAVVSGFAWLGVILFTGEYHRKYAGEKKSWKMMAYVLGIQLFIILLGMLVTGQYLFQGLV